MRNYNSTSPMLSRHQWPQCWLHSSSPSMTRYLPYVVRHRMSLHVQGTPNSRLPDDSMRTAFSG